MVNLNSAANYVVLTGSTLTNTGTTNVCGGLLGAVTSSTGAVISCNSTPVVVDVASIAVATAETDLTAAYNDASTRPINTVITGEKDPGGQTLTPGVYYSASSAGITTGNLTLDGTGVTNPVFIFEIGTTLITASSSQVNLINVPAANVYWVVGSSATLGASSSFAGNHYGSGGHYV